MDVTDRRPRYDAEYNRIEVSPRSLRELRLPSVEYPYPHDGGLAAALLAVVFAGLLCGGLIEMAAEQHQPIMTVDGGPVHQDATARAVPNAAEYEARLDAVAAWRGEAVAIIDEAARAWDDVAARYGPACQAGADTPPCRLLRSYEARTRSDLRAAGAALSMERLAVLETLAVNSGQRNDAGADTAIERELDVLERLHPVCLRWHAAAAAGPDPGRGQPRCPDPEPGTEG